MSLIVAHCIDGEIHMVCDTRVFDDRVNEALPPRDECLKLAIVKADIAVGYAGNRDYASAGLERLLKESPSFESGILILREASINGQAEFILAGLNPLRLARIARGVSEVCQNAFVGHAAAFRQFQMYMLGAYDSSDLSRPHVLQFDSSRKRAQTQREVLAKDGLVGGTHGVLMQSALQCVIHDAQFAAVGGFIARVAGREQFRYMDHAGVTAGFTRQSIPSGKWTAITWGSAADGAYAYTFMTGFRIDRPEQGSAAIYLPHGRFGYLFAFAAGEGLRPILIRDVSHEEFVQRCEVGYRAQVNGLKIGG